MGIIPNEKQVDLSTKPRAYGAADLIVDFLFLGGWATTIYGIYTWLPTVAIIVGGLSATLAGLWLASSRRS